jgi:hypothetical protein
MDASRLLYSECYRTKPQKKIPDTRVRIPKHPGHGFMLNHEDIVSRQYKAHIEIKNKGCVQDPFCPSES